jgi:hypothetical protein
MLVWTRSVNLRRMRFEQSPKLSVLFACMLASLFFECCYACLSIMMLFWAGRLIMRFMKFEQPPKFGVVFL